MKRNSKILIMLLTFALFLGSLVVYAFAADSNEAKIDHTEYKSNPIAAVNDVTYDSFETAFKAAEDGDTLYVYTDVEGIINVEKSITVITDKKFNYTSATHKATVIEGGVKFETAKANEIIEVYFVNPIDMKNFTIIKVAHGNRIFYNGQLDIPETEINYINGTVYGFVGWSTDISAKEPTLVTEFPVASPEHSTMLVYYAIFKTTTPDFVVVDTDGGYEKSAVASEFEAVAETLTDGQKIILLKNIELDTASVEITTSGSYYFDLNGHSITDTFLAADKICLFKIEICSLYIYSSRPGATIMLEASDNSQDGATVVQVHTGALLYIGDAGANEGKGYGDNLTVYSATVADATHVTGTVYIGGGTYVRNRPDYASLLIARAGVVNAKNATFYTKLTENAALIHTTATTSSVSLDNCVVATTLCNGASQKLINAFAEGSTVSINNCTLANVTLTAATTTNGTMLLTGVNKLMSAAPDYATVPEDYELVKYNGKVIVLDSDFTIPYALVDPANAIDVIWQNADGSEIKTEKYAVGGNALYVGASLDIVTDFYTRKHTGWDVRGENLTEDTVITAVYEDAIVADVKNVVHNMTITDSLDLNVYVPAGDVIASISISTDGERKDIKGEVKDGYYVITKSYNPNKVSTEFVLYVTVKVGDMEDVYEIRASVLSYAKTLLENTNSTDADKGLIMDMLVYANEACKYFDGKEDSEIKAVLDNTDYSAFINAGAVTLDGVTPATTSDIAFAVSGARLSLKSASKYVFTVADSYEGTVTVSADFLAENVVLGADGVLGGISIKDMASDITVTVSGASGDVSATYNLATYALAEETDCRALSLALYIFANTAKNYQ